MEHGTHDAGQHDARANRWRRAAAWLAAAFACCAGCTAPPPLPAARVPPAAEGVDRLFGVQLGVALAAQMPRCERGADGFALRAAATPCWHETPRGWREVRLPASVFAELGAIEVRSVREDGGVVVELDLEFDAASVARMERYLRRHKGAPAESERYERGSRVFGIASVRLHTWRSAGATLHFDERSASDRGRVRLYLDRWAEAEARRGG